MAARLIEFDYFRGITIFVVVFWHMSSLLGLNEFTMNSVSVFSKLFAFTFSCSTSFFVFMSGFMFYWIYYQRGFRFGTFLRGKFNNLFRPYFCIATIFSLLHIIYGTYTGRIAEWNIGAGSELERFLYNTFVYWSFWYMPFIAVVFILSPVYLRFIKCRLSLQIFFLILATVANCYLGRYNINPFQSCAYFSVYYLFGIFCAQNYNRIRNFSVKFWIGLLEFYLMLILLSNIFGVYYGGGAVRLLLPTGGGIIKDCTAIFKLPECLLLLWFSEKLINIFEGLKEILPIMGKYSFTIFFLHQFFIATLDETFFWTVGNIPLRDSAWLYVIGFAMAIIVCTICIFIAKFLKEKIGANSRIYIGV